MADANLRGVTPRIGSIIERIKRQDKERHDRRILRLRLFELGDFLPTVQGTTKTCHFSTSLRMTLNVPFSGSGNSGFGSVEIVRD
jgi:hypothetical protein